MVPAKLRGSFYRADHPITSAVDNRNATLYKQNMIKSFRHKGLQVFFETGSKAGIQPHHAKKLKLLLVRLEGWLGVDNGGRADLWIGQQAAYDLWQARKAGMPKVQRAELMAA